MKEKQKQKKELFEFYSNIYPRKIWCYFGKDAEFLARTFNPMAEGATKEEETKQLKKYFESNSTGWTAKCWREEDRDLGILVTILVEDRPEIDIIRTIAHEAVHIVDALYEDLGITAQSYTDTNEPYAYLLEWVVGNIYENYLKYKANESN